MVYFVYLKKYSWTFCQLLFVLESELTCVHHILIIHFDNLIIFKIELFIFKIRMLWYIVYNIAHYYIVNLIGNLKSVLTFYAGVY